MSAAAKMPAPEERPRATLADLLAIPEEKRFHEIVNGELVQRALPSGPHCFSVGALTSEVLPVFGRRPSGNGPGGGWWILPDPDVRLEEHEIYRPDVAGWRREHMPKVPKDFPVEIRPDWVCEVLSPSNARNDTIRKMRVYHRVGVPHYWIVDPREETLTVYRHSPEGYVVLLLAERGDRVRAEPFTDLELQVTALFDDPETPDE